jgi:hypothetical protein
MRTRRSPRNQERLWRALGASNPIPDYSARIFSGVFPCGISYADRARERHGDYVTLAFLSFRTLALEYAADCPPELRAWIATDAAAIQARRGETFQVSTAGQTVTLGR